MRHEDKNIQEGMLFDSDTSHSMGTQWGLMLRPQDRKWLQGRGWGWVKLAGSRNPQGMDWGKANLQDKMNLQGKECLMLI